MGVQVTMPIHIATPVECAHSQSFSRCVVMPLLEARRWCALLLCLSSLTWAGAVHSAGCGMPPLSSSQLRALDIDGWLQRMRRATDLNTYSGQFNVLSSSGVVSSSRVWHVCEPERQIERMEALSGNPRIVYRQNAEVRSFLPAKRVVKITSRDMPRKFALPHGVDEGMLAAHYVAQLSGHEQLISRTADVLDLRPRDALRFGYRIWLDRESGLVLKWQTISAGGKVLEEAGFSRLALETPVGGAQIEAMMNDVVGYRVVRDARAVTTLHDHGWSLHVPVPGFVLLNCTQTSLVPDNADKAALAAAPLTPVQCVYSDGLATVSVFLEAYGEDQRAYEGQGMRLGATQTLSMRVAQNGWVTMVGEVPLLTLRRFASAIKHVEQ